MRCWKHNKFPNNKNISIERESEKQGHTQNTIQKIPNFVSTIKSSIMTKSIFVFQQSIVLLTIMWRVLASQSLFLCFVLGRGCLLLFYIAVVLQILTFWKGITLDTYLLHYWDLNFITYFHSTKANLMQDSILFYNPSSTTYFIAYNKWSRFNMLLTVLRLTVLRLFPCHVQWTMYSSRWNIEYADIYVDLT